MENYEQIFYLDCPHFTVGRVDQWGEQGYLLFGGKIYAYEEDRKDQCGRTYSPTSIEDFLIDAERLRITVPDDFMEKLKENRMSIMNPKVDWFFNKAKKWQEEYEKLRAIALDCGLTEELKWGCPCYTFNGGNIVLIHGFKDYCALLFFKGALLDDPDGILVRQTENVQSARQIRFADIREIFDLEPVVKAYITQAIEVEKAGLKVGLKKTAEFNMPEEFQNKLDSDPALKTAFEALTPGRQRGYLLYFSSAKQSKTRTARVDKYLPQIMKGKGLDDQ